MTLQTGRPKSEPERKPGAQGSVAVTTRRDTQTGSAGRSDSVCHGDTVVFHHHHTAGPPPLLSRPLRTALRPRLYDLYNIYNTQDE